MAREPSLRNTLGYQFLRPWPAPRFDVALAHRAISAEHVMVTFESLRKSFLPSMGIGRAAPDVPALRELCFTLLADVPACDRKAMLLRIENMRRAEDTWHLRGALFDVISLFHGEATARERLATLDARMR